MKKMILSLMGLVCLYFSHAQDLTHSIAFNGKTIQIHHKSIIKTENGQNYAKVDGEFYLIQWKEKNTQGPTNFDFYVEKSDGSVHSLSDEFLDFKRKEAEEQGRHVLKFKEYPDSKPFVRDTSASGKTYKWYDVIRTKEGRLVSRDEFNSYRGNYTYVKRIKGGDYAMDTTIIVPPTEASIKAEEKRQADFEAQVGQPAKEFKAQDIYGNEYALSELKGKIVVMNFWFIACPPCIKEIPELNGLVDKYGTEDVVFLAFATDTEERLGKFLSKSQFKYQVFAKSMDLASTYLVAAYPTSFVIDKKGIVRYAHTGLGKSTISDIEETIERSME